MSLPRPPHLLILPVTTLTLREGTTLLLPGKPDTGLSVGAQRMVLWPTNLTVFSLSLIPMASPRKPPKCLLIACISHHLHCCLWDSNQRHLSPASSQCLLVASPLVLREANGTFSKCHSDQIISSLVTLTLNGSLLLFLYLLKLFYFEIFIDLHAIARNSREDLGIFGNPVFPNSNSLNHCSLLLLR